MRGSVPAPGAKTQRYGGNTPCVEVRVGGRRLILDAGSGLRALGESLRDPGDPVEADFLFSHYHYDHLQGLPFFAPLAEPGNRFVFHGPRREGRSIQDVLEGQMVPPYFPVTLDHLARAEIEFRSIEPGEPFDIGPVHLTSTELDHPGGSLGYRLEYGGRTLVYATDVEHTERPAETLVELARDADVLLHDAMYTDTEYEERRGWGHSTWAGALATAEAARVKKLVLFHHDPDRDDRALEAVLKRAQKRFRNTFAAREGQTISLSSSHSRRT
ncbi:MAG TPA: MBL fold metallo-hydrolase [Myxococcaceae bacterium]|nr:MBL fold metallo-hydrolase [Myxococcaceae bacterium]